jgi:hypothetical protein
VFDIVKLRNIEVDEIKEAVNIASTSALPEKSRNRYEFTYESFKNWCGRKNVSTVMHKVMLAYILGRSQQLKSPASLWCDWGEYSRYRILRFLFQINFSTFIIVVKIIISLELS